MKLIHSNGYNDNEKKAFKEIIISNIIQSMKQILEGMATLEIPLEKEENQKHRLQMLETSHHVDSTTDIGKVAEAVTELWKDQGVQNCYKRSAEYQLNDSAK